MPPKYKKAAEVREIEVERDDREESVLSEATVGIESVASSVTVTSDHLEHILQANHSSIAALIAALPIAASRPEASDTRTMQIKLPKWSDDESPFDYYTKFEKAMNHNKVKECDWPQVLPVCLTGRV